MRTETKRCEKCGHAMKDCDPLSNFECWCGGLMYPRYVKIDDKGGYMRFDVI